MAKTASIHTWGIQSVVEGVYIRTLTEQEFNEFWRGFVGEAGRMKRGLVSDCAFIVDTHVGSQQHLHDLEVSGRCGRTDGPARFPDDLRVRSLQQQLDDGQVARRSRAHQD